jgi:hypothetical protein
MLSRKNDVDKIQHVLSVLHKFQFLLSLPGIILQATQANQYDKVCTQTYSIMPPFFLSFKLILSVWSH